MRTCLHSNLLLWLFLAAWGGRAAHDLNILHDHDHAHCSAALQKGNIKHLHGEEYNPDDACALCAVWLNAAAFLQQDLSLYLNEHCYKLVRYSGEAIANSSQVNYAAPRRGPPTV